MASTRSLKKCLSVVCWPLQNLGNVMVSSLETSENRGEKEREEKRGEKWREKEKHLQKP